jgi:hypothetical protein
MKRLLMVAAMAALLVPVPLFGEEPVDEGDVVGTVRAVRGEVQIGREGTWSPAALDEKLREGEIIRAGKKSEASILFEDGVTAVVGEGVEIAVADLELKTRLEMMKSKISRPTDSKRVGLEVTTTTGVRGTEQTEEKSEELKREHYWSDKPSPKP